MPEPTNDKKPKAPEPDFDTRPHSKVMTFRVTSDEPLSVDQFKDLMLERLGEFEELKNVNVMGSYVLVKGQAIYPNGQPMLQATGRTVVSSPAEAHELAKKRAEKITADRVAAGLETAKPEKKTTETPRKTKIAKKPEAKTESKPLTAAERKAAILKRKLGKK